MVHQIVIGLARDESIVVSKAQVEVQLIGEVLVLFGRAGIAHGEANEVEVEAVGGLGAPEPILAKCRQNAVKKWEGGTTPLAR